jgi:hypothetical protein
VTATEVVVGVVGVEVEDVVMASEVAQAADADGDGTSSSSTAILRKQKLLSRRKVDLDP